MQALRIFNNLMFMLVCQNTCTCCNAARLAQSSWTKHTWKCLTVEKCLLRVFFFFDSQNKYFRAIRLVTLQKCTENRDWDSDNLTREHPGCVAFTLILQNVQVVLLTVCQLLWGINQNRSVGNGSTAEEDSLILHYVSRPASLFCRNRQLVLHEILRGGRGVVCLKMSLGNTAEAFLKIII